MAAAAGRVSTAPCHYRQAWNYLPGRRVLLSSLVDSLVVAGDGCCEKKKKKNA